MKHLCCTLLLTLFLCGAAETTDSFTIGNRRFEVVFADPEKPAPPGADCRFMLPGWIRSLTRKESGEPIFRTRPLLRSHPVSGCAMELVPAIPVSRTGTPDRIRKLKLGIGIIDEDSRYSFYADPIELFPWKIERSQNGGASILNAVQNSGYHDGYAYELHIRITVSAGSSEIRYEQELKNTGKQFLKFQAYFHPFFEAEKEYADAWILLPDTGSGLPRKIAPDRNIEVPFSPPINSSRWVGAGRLGKYAVRIECSLPLSLVKIWSSPIDCFAVEPHTDLMAAPGETIRWDWVLTIQ